MPMFDFVCAACGIKFEDLIRGDALPSCPQCGAVGAKRQMSAPSPLKTGAFPYKHCPPSPMGQGMPSCGMDGGCPGGFG